MNRSAEIEENSDLSVNPESDRSDESPTPYGKIAKRLTGWTSNLLATSMILVIALVGGRELVSWWRADSADNVDAANVSPAAKWSVPHDSYLLEFGDSPFQFQRDRVVGERQQALDQIQTRCRQALSRRPVPHATVGDAERRLLETISDSEPIEQVAGSWRIFLSAGPMPMLIGIRDDCEVNADGAGDSPSRENQTSRLVVWGMAIPASDQVWNTYTCQTTQKNDSATYDQISVPLPAGARKTLAITSHDGGKIIGFSADNSIGGPAEIALFFDRVTIDNGWNSAGVWQSTRTNWRAEFTRESPSPIRMEIQLFAQREDSEVGGSIRGLITIMPEI